MGYSKFFRDLTNHYPYSFQESIGECLLEGNSVVFRAPTGAGKTWTTVAPFLYSLQAGQQRLADRLIYALPLRALAASLHQTVVDALGKTHLVEVSAKGRTYPAKCVYCSLQMGGENNDPFFEGDLIFCTIDQVLSGYLMMPLSLPARLGNIVAGALCGSLLVLDEAHLLESGIALGTVIEMLDRLRGLVQFVFMTATMSDSSIQWLAKKLGATAPALAAGEIRQLPVQRTKKRSWCWRDHELDIPAIEEAHKAGRTLVIVNRVSRAQDLFRKLEHAYRGKATCIACLHARFLPEHRAATEGRLQSWFGKAATETDVILVTTQVVEAGMDISADHVLTELTPMSALVQRAGRTARYVERCEGTISVFSVESVKPYSDEDQEVTRTKESLAELDPQGELVDFEREQSWIERVHGCVETRALGSYNNLFGRRQFVESAIRDGERGRLSELVRDIDSVNVLLTSDPGTVEFHRSRWPALFSVPRTSIWSLKKAFDAGSSEVWTAKEIDDESGPLRFRWTQVSSRSELAGCWLIAAGPSAALYSKEAGLELGQAGNEFPVQYTLRPPTLLYSYCYETWVDHVRRVMEQAGAMRDANALGARKLEHMAGLHTGTIEGFVQLAAVLHDVGKLAEEWQEKAWQWETQQTGRLRSEAIAHTTKEPMEKGPTLPHHAVEGAFAAADFLVERVRDGAWPIGCAIARHHSARSKEAGAFVLLREASELLGRLGTFPITFRDGKDRLELKEFSRAIGAGFDDIRDSWPIYAYVARRLRLADQAGTAMGAREGGSR